MNMEGENQVTSSQTDISLKTQLCPDLSTFSPYSEHLHSQKLSGQQHSPVPQHHDNLTQSKALQVSHDDNQVFHPSPSNNVKIGRQVATEQKVKHASPVNLTPGIRRSRKDPLIHLKVQTYSPNSETNLNCPIKQNFSFTTSHPTPNSNFKKTTVKGKRGKGQSSSLLLPSKSPPVPVPLTASSLVLAQKLSTTKPDVLPTQSKQSQSQSQIESITANKVNPDATEKPDDSTVKPPVKIIKKTIQKPKIPKKTKKKKIPLEKVPPRPLSPKSILENEVKIVYTVENGNIVKYSIPYPDPKSSPVVFNPPPKAPEKNSENQENVGIDQENPENPSEPLTSSNADRDREKYRDFVHCCKCFTTFYNFRDLARHFDQCTEPYPNPNSTRNFKDYKTQQQKEKENDTPSAIDPNDPSLNAPEDLNRDLEVDPENIDEVCFLEEGEIPTAFTSKKPVPKNTIPDSLFWKRKKPFRKHPDRVYRPRGSVIPKKRVDPNQVDRLGGGHKCIEPDCSHLDFPSYSAFLSHMKEVHGVTRNFKDVSTPRQCPECEETFKSSLSLELHMNRHRGYIHRYTCTFEGCHRRYKFRARLRRHERKIHYPEQRIPCPVPGCSETFYQTCNLRDHQNSVHLKVTPFKCRDASCNLMFSTIKERTSHFKRDHRPWEFVCRVENCGKAFNLQSNLKKHILTHQDKSERRTFFCDFPDCGASFVSQASLNGHTKWLHQGLERSRDFLCPTCGKAFYLEKQLRNHSVIHSQETPHLCSFCGKRFKLKTALNQHLKIHTGERPYVCRHCDKTFTGTGAWHRHEQTHTGFRPYQCKFCGEKFHDNRTLKRHVAGQHHEDCEFDLSDTSTYQIYMKRPKGVSSTDLEQDSASNQSNS